MEQLLSETVIPFLKLVHADQIAEVVSVATASFVAWKKYLRPFNQKIQRLVAVVPVIEQMAAEYRPNGGSTLRDAIDRIDRDVFELRQAQRARIVMDGHPHWESDKTGKCLWVSKAWCELTGLSESEAEGNGWVNCIHEHDRERVWEEWNDAVKQSRDYHSVYRCRRPDGKIVTVKSRGVVLRDRSGKPSSIAGVTYVINPDETN